MSCTTDKIAATLQALSYPPKLIITDSQVFIPFMSKNRQKAFSPLFRSDGRI